MQIIDYLIGYNIALKNLERDEALFNNAYKEIVRIERNELVSAARTYLLLEIFSKPEVRSELEKILSVKDKKELLNY